MHVCLEGLAKEFHVQLTHLFQIALKFYFSFALV